MKVIVKAVEGLLPEPDLSHLKTDFQNYKEGIYTPNYFGRDGDFSHPLLARRTLASAHNQARSREIMNGLAMIAEDFRQRF
jgi:hypothetical protein